MSILVALDNTCPNRRADGIFGDDRKGVAINRGRECAVPELREVLLKLPGKDLGPDGARDRIAERRADVVQREVKPGDDSDVLVFGGGLDAGLSGIRKHASCKTEEALCADDSILAGRIGAATVVDQQAECDHEEASASDDEIFELADFVDDKTKAETCDDRDKGVERGDACGGQDGEVEGNDTHGVEVITLQVPGEVEEGGDTKSCPDCTVTEQVERNKRVARLEFPEHEDRHTKNADN